MIKNLYIKYKEIIPYAVFGVLTTLVNVVVYWICAYVFELSVMTSTIVAWVIAVMFAYITNRKWVFHSEADTTENIIKELFIFIACRLSTGVVDWLCMFIFVDKMCLNDVLIKNLANIFVIVLNYVASKFVIFKRKERQ